MLRAMLLLVIAITSGVSSRIFDFPAVDVGGRTELKILDELVVKVAEGIDTIIDVEAVNKGDDGRTILHVAATAGHTKAIEALVELGASISVRDEKGRTPLHEAAGGGHVAAISTLLAAGASLSARNEDRETPLHKAAAYGHPEAIRILVGAGASLGAENKRGESPLLMAAERGHASAISMLVTVLGASLSARDKDGNTPLHKAAEHGQTKAIIALAAAGASHKALNKNGNTPLHVAADHDQAFAITALVNAGAHLEARTDYGLTPLHFAALNGSLASIRKLVTAGASLDAKTALGGTPLHLAAHWGHSEAVETLLAAGACLKTRTLAGNTPLQLAIIRGHVKIVKTLKAASYVADFTLVVTFVMIVAFIFRSWIAIFFADVTHAQASVATMTTMILAFIAAKMLTPYDRGLSMFEEALLRLFDCDDLTTAITATCLLSIYFTIIFGRGSYLWALFGRAPARATSNAAAKRQKSRGSAPATHSELARREKGAARKAAAATEQQVKRKASEREKAASHIAVMESQEAAQGARTTARESEPASKAADTRAVAASNQPEGSAAAQRLADEHASEIEAAQLHKALEDSAREARELAELTAIEAHELAVCMEASPSPEVESRESGGRGRRKDRGGRGGRGGPGGRGGRGQVYNRDTAPSLGAVAEASADLATRLGLAAAPPTPGGIAPTLSNGSVPVEEEQAATVTAPAAAPLSVAADVPGPAQPSSSAPDAERTCVVCLHGPQSHIAWPCGHLIYCGGCAALMRGKPCAFCMNDVSEIKEVFRG